MDKIKYKISDMVTTPSLESKAKFYSKRTHYVPRQCYNVHCPTSLVMFKLIVYYLTRAKEVVTKRFINNVQDSSVSSCMFMFEQTPRFTIAA